MADGPLEPTAHDEPVAAPTSLGRILSSSRRAAVLEMVAVLAVGVAGLVAAATLAGRSQVAGQAVVWVANVGMLALVWVGLRARGEGWDHIGLPFRMPGVGDAWGGLWRAALVAVVALVVFVLAGALAGALLTGTAGAAAAAPAAVPEAPAASPAAADLGGYAYLRGNPGLLVLTLLGVYVVSSVGEEVIYRGFLMTRIAELGGGGRGAWATALATSAVVFGVAHWPWGPVGVVQTAFMGLAIGALWLTFGRNLWVTVLAHGVLDTLLIVPLYSSA